MVQPHRIFSSKVFSSRAIIGLICLFLWRQTVGERVDERPRRYVDNLHATGIGIVLDVKIAPESHHKALQHVMQVKPSVCLDNPGRLLSLFLLFIEMLDDIADIVVLVDRKGSRPGMVGTGKIYLSEAFLHGSHYSPYHYIARPGHTQALPVCEMREPFPSLHRSDVDGLDRDAAHTIEMKPCHRKESGRYDERHRPVYGAELAPYVGRKRRVLRVGIGKSPGSIIA